MLFVFCMLDCVILIVYNRVITRCICLLLLSSCVLMFFWCGFGLLVGLFVVLLFATRFFGF